MRRSETCGACVRKRRWRVAMPKSSANISLSWSSIRERRRCGNWSSGTLCHRGKSGGSSMGLDRAYQRRTPGPSVAHTHSPLPAEALLSHGHWRRPARWGGLLMVIWDMPELDTDQFVEAAADFFGVSPKEIHVADSEYGDIPRHDDSDFRIPSDHMLLCVVPATVYRYCEELHRHDEKIQLPGWDGEWSVTPFAAPGVVTEKRPAPDWIEEDWPELQEIHEDKQTKLGMNHFVRFTRWGFSAFRK